MFGYVFFFEVCFSFFDFLGVDNIVVVVYWWEVCLDLGVVDVFLLEGVVGKCVCCVLVEFLSKELVYVSKLSNLG